MCYTGYISGNKTNEIYLCTLNQGRRSVFAIGGGGGGAKFEKKF